ncbi:GDSL esterase/lipase At5g33370 isoform X3 [Hevea brasiliensis]|uniref:GDSL esterase/lipase At5g33370 isoform X3 n=1 Tax=Hevea brasiliensis TaxID=3981 RepID=UPI0025DB0FD0|nr:GDSL esterase/lipase At5g33370 isoform X3 [Hevea brasiliensis]
MASSLIIMSSVMVLALVMALGSVASQAEARAFFVFGDSLVDNGQQIGSEFLLPYLSPQLTGKKLLVGANFASAGIGILNDTGIQFEYQRSVTALIGAQITKQLANGALVLITVGGNDFVNNYYFVPNSIRSRQYNLPDYVKFLISEYKKILMKLYDLGARKVLVTGTGSLGCVPAELAMRSRNGQCAAELQRAASLFNPQLIQMIGQLNRQYRSNIFIAANTRKMSADFINNPGAFGFITAKVACCGQGPYNGIGLCTPTSNLCPNRDVFAFWDPFHPAERANRYIVQQILRGTNEYMNPMNLSTILALDFRT